MNPHAAVPVGTPDAAWQRPLQELPELVHLAPPVNRPDDTLIDVIEAFARDPGAGTIFVVDDEDRLLGCIQERALDADLISVVLPQRLWHSIREMDARDALRAARAPRRKARELMVGVRSVTPRTALVEAVGIMIRSEQPTVPLVDQQGRLLGYLRLFEVLSHFLQLQLQLQLQHPQP
jgi:CBS-domain-containing membrane protein